jgi:hypothetical protein
VRTTITSISPSTLMGHVREKLISHRTFIQNAIATFTAQRFRILRDAGIAITGNWPDVAPQADAAPAPEWTSRQTFALKNLAYQ